jgi:hypothetical protein
MCYNTEAEAIAAKLKDIDENAWGYIDFDGMNCDEENNCNGWDGESRRCDCGNRRVYWYTSQNEKGLWSANAEAY